MSNQWKMVGGNYLNQDNPLNPPYQGDKIQGLARL